MLPGTLATLIGFVLFVAPGLLYELMVERYRPPTPGSTFREISRVALVSLACTTLAVVVALIVREVFPSQVVDVERWLRVGARYRDGHFELVVWNAVALVAVSCGFAALGYYSFVGRKISRAAAARHDPSSAMWATFFGSLSSPETRSKSAKLWVLARTTDHHVFIGRVGALDVDPDVAHPMLTLQAPITIQRPGEAMTTLADDWARLVLPVPSLREILLQWVDD